MKMKYLLTAFFTMAFVSSSPKMPSNQVVSIEFIDLANDVAKMEGNRLKNADAQRNVIIAELIIERKKPQ